MKGRSTLSDDFTMRRLNGRQDYFRLPYEPKVPDFEAMKKAKPEQQVEISPEDLEKIEAKTEQVVELAKPIADFPAKVDTFKNKHGATVLRLRFETFEALEAYFAENLIGADAMKGSASKVIGKTLLIWDRKK